MNPVHPTGGYYYTPPLHTASSSNQASQQTNTQLHTTALTSSTPTVHAHNAARRRANIPIPHPCDSSTVMGQIYAKHQEMGIHDSLLQTAYNAIADAANDKMRATWNENMTNGQLMTPVTHGTGPQKERAMVTGIFERKNRGSTLMTLAVSRWADNKLFLIGECTPSDEIAQQKIQFEQTGHADLNQAVSEVSNSLNRTYPLELTPAVDNTAEHQWQYGINNGNVLTAIAKFDVNGSLIGLAFTHPITHQPIILGQHPSVFALPAAYNGQGSNNDFLPPSQNNAERWGLGPEHYNPTSAPNPYNSISEPGPSHLGLTPHVPEDLRGAEALNERQEGVFVHTLNSQLGQNFRHYVEQIITNQQWQGHRSLALNWADEADRFTKWADAAGIDIINTSYNELDHLADRRYLQETQLSKSASETFIDLRYFLNWIERTRSSS